MVPLLLTACLERVTGEDVPLDPRFYAGEQGSSQNGGGGSADPSAGGTGDGAWVGFEGETVLLTGTIVAEDPSVVQVDVLLPAPEKPGGVDRAGALHIPPGGFEIKVPKDVPRVLLQAFQDPDADGPGESDPYAEGAVDLSSGEPQSVTLKLVKGARAAPGSGGPGPGGGGPGPGGGSGVGPGAGFGTGPMVTVSGTVTATRAFPIWIDFFKVDPAVPGGRSILGKVPAQAGEWTVKIQENMGPIEIEAYQDPAGDGPTADDPKARCEQNPLVVAAADIAGIALAIP